MAMFSSQIKITGKHALILQKYCKDKGSEQDVAFIVTDNFGNEKRIHIFERRIDCYMVAAMLGIIKDRKASPDKSSNASASVFHDVIEKERKNLDRIYHHMILSSKDDLSADAKVKKAFSVINDDVRAAEEQKNIEDYVRGGLEIIDDYFKDCKTYEDVCNAIIDMTEVANLSND